jgi:hypothetical protein
MITALLVIILGAATGTAYFNFMHSDEYRPTDIIELVLVGMATGLFYIGTAYHAF